MKTFKCSKCKGLSYSSVPKDQQKSPQCPYCGSKKTEEVEQ